MPQVSFDVVNLQVRGSDPNRFYVVTLLGGTQPVACTCPSFEHRDGPKGTPGGCKHMKARVGPGAVGTTKCGRCRALLTPADFDHDAQMAAATSVDPSALPAITCMECWSWAVSPTP